MIRSVSAPNPSTSAIAAPDRYSAETAKTVFERGGNAIDAAVAASFTLAVTYPEAGNIAGGGFMTLVMNGKPMFLDYREEAPAAASRSMYLDDKGEVIPGKSVVGAFSVGVPGTVLALWEAHKRFGTLPWHSLVQPAIGYARDGIDVVKIMTFRRDAMIPDFEGKTNFLDYFGSLEVGTIFRQPELAKTLERIAKHGPGEFYEGRTAELMLTEIGKRGGVLTAQDLREYKVVWREPLNVAWNGQRVITAPPPSSGGIGLVQHLKIKEYLQKHFDKAKHNSTQYIHLVTEIAKQVFIDRAEYIDDPDFVSVPVEQLLNAAYIAKRAKAIDIRLPTPIEKIRPGLAESEETTHFSLIDRWGNAVSNTFTLNSKFGSGVVVEGGGFLLNNGMDDFSSKPGTTNRFGLMSSQANAIAPKKRMVSSMTPTIMTREDGSVSLVIGTPGGSRIFTSLFQVLNNIYQFKLPLAESIAAMRVHHQLHPLNTIFYEPYWPIGSALAADLGRLGYKVQERYTNGDMQVVRIHDDGSIEAASDPRARGVSLIIDHRATAGRNTATASA